MYDFISSNIGNIFENTWEYIQVRNHMRDKSILERSNLVRHEMVHTEEKTLINICV